MVLIGSPIAQITLSFKNLMFFELVSQIAWPLCSDTKRRHRTVFILNCFGLRFFAGCHFYKKSSTTLVSQTIVFLGINGLLLYTPFINLLISGCSPTLLSDHKNEEMAVLATLMLLKASFSL